MNDQLQACPRCQAPAQDGQCAQCGCRFARHLQQTPNQDDARLGDLLGFLSNTGYQIQGRLDAGGQAVVLAGIRRYDGLPVVIKTPRDDRADPRRRLLDEARALTSCQDTAVPKLLDIDISPGNQAVLIMTRQAGSSLRRCLQEGRLDAHGFRLVAQDIARVLAHIAPLGLVHRDIKPDNIVLDPAGASLIDFGLALVERPRQAWGEQRQTPVGSLLGTPPYVAPEQLSHPSQVDPRADWYAFGVTLAECLASLSGTLPRRERASWHTLIKALQAVDPERRPHPERVKRLVKQAPVSHCCHWQALTASALAMLALWGGGHLLVPSGRSRLISGRVDAEGDRLVLQLPGSGQLTISGQERTRLRLPGGSPWTSGPLTIRGQPGEQVLLFLRDSDGFWQVLLE
jgi:serine/threonine protein kinase